MNTYLSLLQMVLTTGVRQKNRTGIDTLMIPGSMMTFDNVVNRFPILTTKKMPFRTIVGELLAFIRGYNNASDFRRLGAHIWDKNANENKQWLENEHRKGQDDLGRIYGVQWRKWRSLVDEPEEPGVFRVWILDQLNQAIQTIIRDPQSRRIIVTAWRPDELEEMALPPCHLLYQFLVEQERQKLHMTMYMRSCDMFLGVPFNISSYALLLSLVAKATGLTAGRLTMFLADVHIYVNHIEQVKEQLSRSPLPLPKLQISSLLPQSSLHKEDLMHPIEWLESLEPGEFFLENYEAHPPIKGEMAI